MKQIISLFLILNLSACVAQPTPESTLTIGAPFVIKPDDNLYAPKPEDVNLKIGGVILTSLDLAEQADSDPVRVKLYVLGSVPRVCDELRIEVENPDEEYRIFVNVYSLVNPNVKCENVFQQFEATLLLGVYSAGRYTVWVNNELVGDFISSTSPTER